MPRWIDGHRVYDCPMCQDEGVVEVVDTWVRRDGHAPLRKFLKGELACPTTSIVYCTCGYGQGRTPQFSESRMFAIDRDVPTTQWIAEFRQWFEQGHNLGRESAFDVFNARGVHC